MTVDPTTASIEAQNTEREQLRAENQRLRRELTAACTEVEAVKAERDADRRALECAARATAEQITARANASFVAGYDQAVLEIRDHFAKAGDHGVVHVIETTWLKRPA